MKSEQIKEITERATEQLVAALNAGHSETLTGYLKAIGRFHRYSLHNVMLIASQKPNASYVAGFRTRLSGLSQTYEAVFQGTYADGDHDKTDRRIPRPPQATTLHSLQGPDPQGCDREPRTECLTCLLDLAVHRQYIPENPARAVKHFNELRERPEKQMLTLEQENRILQAASPHLHVGIILLVQSGGRTVETSAVPLRSDGCLSLLS
jgi:hypothetical protein